MFKRTVLVPVGMMLFGCSTHPLVDDVTRQSTYEIVESIRCEATSAVAELGMTDATLKQTYIGYDFQFLITENNNATASSLFTYPFATGTFTAGLNAGSQRARASDRNFRIVESFHTLLGDRDKCGKGPPRGPNRKYPIAGSIGLKEVINTYVKLNELTHLVTAGGGGGREGREGGGDQQPGEGRGKSGRSGFIAFTDPGPEDLPETVTIFSDKLTFTTKLVGGLKPSVKLSPVKGRFRLAEAAADLSADRTDVHKVTVAMAVEKSCKYLNETQCGKNARRCIWDKTKKQCNDKEGAAKLGFYRTPAMTPFLNYSPFAPAPAQALASGPGKVILELDRQRLLEIVGPLGVGLEP